MFTSVQVAQGILVALVQVALVQVAQGILEVFLVFDQGFPRALRVR